LETLGGTSNQHFQSTTSAYSASVHSQTQQSQNWFIDFSASHHLTLDATNLMDATSSHGGENVLLGN